MKKKHRLTKEQRNRLIRNAVILALICYCPWFMEPRLRAWIIENPMTVLLVTVQVILLFCVLALGAYLVLKWVRAEKSEEDES